MLPHFLFLLFLLHLSLLCVPAVMGQRTVVFISQSLNWTDARAYCRQQHTDLVTVQTAAENDELDENCWLGLYRDGSDTAWRWSRGDEPLTFSAEWKSGYENSGNCVYKHKGDNGPWRTNECDVSHKFFCVDEALVLVRQRKTWEQALVHCRALTGAHSYDLASLLTPENHDYALGLVQDGEAWTGLRFLGDEWTWVGGDPVQYSDLSGCPDHKRCGLVQKTKGLYSTTQCEEQRSFLCSRTPSGT